MARTWLVIDVELVSGGEHGDFWPRPGRTFVAARTDTFEEFAEAIDDAFGRWDLAHLHEFTLTDGTAVGTPDDEFDDDRVILDSRRTRLSRLAAGEQFAYVFDFGDYWTHLCTVGPERADLSRPTAGFLPDRWLSSAGAACPTSTAGDGEATTGRARLRPTPKAVTSRRSCRGGSAGAPERFTPVNPLFHRLRGG